MEERKGSKKKRDKKVKIVSQNKGNFSSFRNKSFIPNASRQQRKDDDSDEDQDEDNNEENEEDEEDPGVLEIRLSGKSKKKANKVAVVAHSRA